jgi:hypothetical protein
MSFSKFILSLFVTLGISQLAHAQSNTSAQVMKTQVAPADASLTKATKWSVGAGFPELFFVQMQRPIALRHYVTITAGYLPAMLAIQELREPMEQRLNDRYSVLVDPKAHGLSIGIGHGYSFTSRFSLETKATLLIVNAGGSASLKNRENGGTARIADLDATLYLPQLNLSLLYAVYKTKSWSVDVGGGVSWILSRSLQTQFAGNAPAFLEVAPEYRQSMIDGRKELETDLNEAVDRLPYQKSFVPSLFLRGTW